MGSDFKPKSNVFISRYQTQFLSVKKPRCQSISIFSLEQQIHLVDWRSRRSLWGMKHKIIQNVTFFFPHKHFWNDFSQFRPARSYLSEPADKRVIISKKLLLKPISVTAFGILLTWRRKPSFSFQGNVLQRESSHGIRSFKCILFDGKVSSLWEARNIWI